MILQALNQLYEDLSRQGKIARPGWSAAKVSYALCLRPDGSLEQAVPLMVEAQRGKKTVLVPQVMDLPAPVKRTVGVAANFLCDNSSYLLGVDGKGKPERTRQCFDAACQLHRQILAQVDSPAAQAILAFFDRWQPTDAATHPALIDCLEELLQGGNLIFRVAGVFAHEDPAIQAAWQTQYDAGGDGPTLPCLITGESGPVALTHPSIKGVADAQSSGAALVSFNAPAFCSYGREQNANAPISEQAAFAYTSALNYLLSDRANIHKIGDATVVCWAEGADPLYTALFNTCLFDEAPPAGITEGDVQAAVKKLARLEPFESLHVKPDQHFYVLGLAPNAARLSVRFFLQDDFGRFLGRIQQHHQRMEIVRPAYDHHETLSVWAMLQETVKQNSRDKSPSPVMAGATVRAILTGGPYPASLLNAVLLRIRAERQVTRGRAAILKAYYTQNSHSDCPKEVLTVALNEQSTNPAYTLGRLFSVLEALQQAANPGINSTIKDKYFNSASATPATIFPILNNLAQKHLKKLEPGQRTFYDKQLTALKGILGEAYPTRLTLPQQGSFDLGYYHQTQKRYAKKEEN